MNLFVVIANKIKLILNKQAQIKVHTRRLNCFCIKWLALVSKSIRTRKNSFLTEHSSTTPETTFPEARIRNTMKLAMILSFAIFIAVALAGI